MRPDVKPVAFENVGLDDLKNVAEKLIHEAAANRVIIFNGEMGSGKTTFIKTIGQVLGVKSSMSSPTFSIVNEYETGSGDTIYHFDFYRLKNESEAYDIGTEEYFDSGSYCFVEWPDKVQSLLPQKYVEVSIMKPIVETQNLAFQFDTRTISFTLHE